jgi:hypothetical protein
MKRCMHYVPACCNPEPLLLYLTCEIKHSLSRVISRVEMTRVSYTVEQPVFACDTYVKGGSVRGVKREIQA